MSVGGLSGPVNASRNPRAIILDLDDTILDSGDPDVSWRRICTEFAGNFDGVTPERFFDALIEARDGFWNDDRRAREGRLDLVAARRTIFGRALAALGVAAIVFQYEMDHDLRSRCLLVPEHPPRIELVGRDGSAPEVVDVDRSTAGSILRTAAERAASLGLGWETEDIRFEPAPKLVELIRRSRKVSHAEQPGA